MVNNVVLMGRMVADPELKRTNSGTNVCSFRIAVERPFGDHQADFIDIVTWKSTADFVSRYFRKGSMIAVVGSLQTRSYEDRSGNKRTAYEIVAQSVSFCGDKTDSGERTSMDRQTSDTGSVDYGRQEERREAFTDEDDELPF